MVPALVPGESVLQLIYLLGSDEREREREGGRPSQPPQTQGEADQARL